MSPWLQGIGIGLAIAAPVGPIGLLVIRRALRHGASSGLATGLGAAVADGTYGLAVAGGLALTGWLQRHATVVSLVGAALLLWMGLTTLRGVLRDRGGARGGEGAGEGGGEPGEAVAASSAGSGGPGRTGASGLRVEAGGSGESRESSAAGTPSESRRKADAPAAAEAPPHPLAAFGSTLLLTLANPATIVSFVAVIGALGPQASGSGAAFALVGGVFLGSLLWWCGLVAGVRALHRTLPAHWLRRIDAVTGIVFVGTAVLVLVHALSGGT